MFGSYGSMTSWPMAMSAPAMTARGPAWLAKGEPFGLTIVGERVEAGSVGRWAWTSVVMQ